MVGDPISCLKPFLQEIPWIVAQNSRISNFQCA